MKKIMIGMAMATVTLGASVIALQAQAPARNAWNGVFTADQAAQGKALFEAKCAICHGAELNGAEMAPPLAGGVFMGNWSGQSLGDLFTRIHSTMPANDPGSLNNQEVVLAISYILSFNKFPAGATALPADDAAQGKINIVSEKPAGK